jgi:hypothetical protein
MALDPLLGPSETSQSTFPLSALFEPRAHLFRCALGSTRFIHPRMNQGFLAFYC